MKLFSSLAVALFTLTRPGIAQTIAPSDLVGTWKGDEVNTRTGARLDNGKYTHTIVLNADRTYSWTAPNGSAAHTGGGKWRMRGDTLRLCCHGSYAIKLEDDKQTLILPTGEDEVWRFTREGKPINSEIAQIVTPPDLIGTWEGTGLSLDNDSKDVKHAIDLKADGTFSWAQVRGSDAPFSSGRSGVCLGCGPRQGDWETMGDTIAFSRYSPFLYKLQDNKKTLLLRRLSDTLWNVTFTRVKP